MKFIRTDGKDKDFIENCRLLDTDLERRVGRDVQRDKYNKFKVRICTAVVNQQ